MKPLDEDWKKRMKKLMETVFAPYAPKNLAFKTEIEGMEKMNKALDKMLFDLEAIEPFEKKPFCPTGADFVNAGPTSQCGECGHVTPFGVWVCPAGEGCNMKGDKIDTDNKHLDMNDRCQYQILGPDWKSAGF